jgi:hypothetical protein
LSGARAALGVLGAQQGGQAQAEDSQATHPQPIAPGDAIAKDGGRVLEQVEHGSNSSTTVQEFNTRRQSTGLIFERALPGKEWARAGKKHII